MGTKSIAGIDNSLFSPSLRGALRDRGILILKQVFDIGLHSLPDWLTASTLNLAGPDDVEWDAFTHSLRRLVFIYH